MVGAPAVVRRAIAANNAARTRSLAAITTRREYRSASVASGADAAAAAIMRASVMSPTAAAPPERKATTARATRYAHVPIIDAAHASWRRRRRGFANTTAIGRRYGLMRRSSQDAADVGRSGRCSTSGEHPNPYEEELLWDRTRRIASGMNAIASDPRSLTSRRT